MKARIESSALASWYDLILFILNNLQIFLSGFLARLKELFELLKDSKGCGAAGWVYAQHGF